MDMIKMISKEKGYCQVEPFGEEQEVAVIKVQMLDGSPEIIKLCKYHLEEMLKELK